MAYTNTYTNSYSRTLYGAKDGLISGNEDKKLKGSDFQNGSDGDFDQIYQEFDKIQAEFSRVQSNPPANGNVASVYYSDLFKGVDPIGDGRVYSFNVASVASDSDTELNVVNYQNPLDGLGSNPNDTGHYAVNITPVTLTGKPCIAVLYGSLVSSAKFKIYELGSDMQTWQALQATKCAFHLTVVDMASN